MQEVELSAPDQVLTRVEALIQRYYPPALEGDASFNELYRCILRALTTGSSQGMGRMEIINTTGLDPMQVSNVLRKLGDQNYKLNEFGLDLKKEGATRSMKYVLKLCEPEDEGEYLLGMRVVNRHCKVVEERLKGIYKTPFLKVTSQPPEDGESLIQNSTWIFHPEKGKHLIVSTLHEVSLKGRTAQTLSLRRIVAERGFEVRRTIFQALSKSSFKYAPELGFVLVNGDPLPKGEVALMWLDTGYRTSMLVRRYPGVRLKSELSYLHSVQAFSMREFLIRRKTAEDTFSEDELKLIDAVASFIARGDYPSFVELSALAGLSNRRISEAIKAILLKSKETGFFLRARNRPGGIEIVLRKLA